MWHQQHPATGHIDNDNLVSDCASGQPTTAPIYSHGVPSHSGSAYGELHWLPGRDSQDIAVNRELTSQACMKGYSDSGNLYDSSRTDSGFLSGANIVSEHCISEEITSSGKSRDLSHQDLHTGEKEGYKDDMRLDSGVDVVLSDNFHSLSIKNTLLNDLNASTSKSSNVVDSSVPFSNIVDPQSTSKTSTTSVKSTTPEQTPHSSPPVWELYFQQDEDGDTQLHIAIIQGFIEVVVSLINIAPHPCFLDIQNDSYQTPLHLAVLTHQPKIVRRLLVSGATVDMKDRTGNTPLHMACQLGDLECVKALTEPVTIAETDTANLQYPVYPQQLPQNLEERNYDGQMCLHLAALSSHIDVLRHLLWFGANINASEAKSGRTVLHYAVERRLTRVMQFLLEECAGVRGAGVQLEAPTYAGHTAYQLATCIDSTLAHRLSEHGAIPKILPDDSDSDSDYSDDDDNENEMYQKSSDDNFSSLRINGQPINISA